MDEAETRLCPTGRSGHVSPMGQTLVAAPAQLVSPILPIGVVGEPLGAGPRRERAISMKLS